MATCDICGGMTTWENGTAYSADEFRMIVAMGYRPDKKFMMLLPEQERGWVDGLVANSTTGWLLCPVCAQRATKYMPKPTGTGSAGHTLDESMTVRQILGSSFLANITADDVPEQKTPPSTSKEPEIAPTAYQWTAVIGDDKECPECAETIKAEARICRFCGARFDVEARGYCTTDHDEVVLDENGRCSICSGEVVDRHIKSRLKPEETTLSSVAPQAPPIAPTTVMPVTPHSPYPAQGFQPRLESPGCLSAYAALLILSSVILLLGGTCGGISVMTTDSDMLTGAVSLVISIGLGTFGILVGSGLWRLKNWARIAIIIAQIASIFLGLLSILSTIFLPDTSASVDVDPSGIIASSLVGIIIQGAILGWFIRNGEYFQEPAQPVVPPTPLPQPPVVSKVSEAPSTQPKPVEITPISPAPTTKGWDSLLDGKQPDQPAQQVPEVSRLVAEALDIIENRVVQLLPGGAIKSGGDASEAMVAADKLCQAHQLHPEDPWLHYAWASALHLAMQYQTGREEMERLSQTHPDFFLAKFAIDGWDQWDGLFLLPPWNPEVERVHPAISGEIKAAYLLGTRQKLQPRGTLFLRDAGGDFQPPTILQSARIDITTVLSPDDPIIAVLYARIWDNPSSPYQAEALGLPLYPRGSELRCKYEYLCLQKDIDFAVIDNHDRILLNKRLSLPKRMRKTHKKLLKLLQSSPGREISNTELVDAVRSFQSQFSLSDVQY